MIPSGSKHPLAIPMLLLILGLALFLRLQGLGDLGLWIDEDLTWLASHSIAEVGAPVLPSGEVYSRGLSYSYLVGAFVSWFGSSLSLLRLPSVLFSLGGIIIVYLMAKRMAGATAGLVAAMVMAVSPWDFHYAQMARMYAMFGMLFTGGVLWIYRGSFEGHAPSRVAALVATALVVPTHQLGAAIGLVYAIPFLFPNRKRPWVFAAAGFATLGFAMWAFRAVRKSLRAAHETDLKSILEFSNQTTTIELPFLPSYVTLNHSSWIAQDLWTASTAVGLCLSLLLAVSTFIFCLRRYQERQPLLAWAMILLFVAMVILNQLILASLAALYLLTTARRPVQSAATRRSFFGGLGGLALDMVLLAGLATVLLVICQAVVHGVSGVTDRHFLRLFFALPVPFYRLLILQFPAMAAVVFLGGFITLIRGIGNERTPVRSYVFLTFVSLLILMGMFLSPYVINRYNVYLNGLFVALFAAMLTDGARFFVAQLTRGALKPVNESAILRDREQEDSDANDWNPSRFRAGFTRQNVLVVGALMTGLLLLCEQFDLSQTWAATKRGYGYNRETLTDPDLISHFRYDYQSAVDFVLKTKSPGDRVAAKEPVELYPYGLKCNYRINKVYGVFAKNTEGQVVDWYLDIPFLSTFEQLQTEIDRTRRAGKRFWIIYPREIENGPAVHLPADVKAMLSGTREVFQADDGVTVVLRF